MTSAKACGTARLAFICCDGCANAFHFKCCDPPKDNIPEELEDPYFCHECRARDAPETNGSIDLSAPAFRLRRAKHLVPSNCRRTIRDTSPASGGQPNGEYTTTTDRVNKYVPIFLRNYAF